MFGVYPNIRKRAIPDHTCVAEDGAGCQVFCIGCALCNTCVANPYNTVVLLCAFWLNAPLIINNE